MSSSIQAKLITERPLPLYYLKTQSLAKVLENMETWQQIKQVVGMIRNLLRSSLTSKLVLKPTASSKIRGRSERIAKNSSAVEKFKGRKNYIQVHVVYRKHNATKSNWNASNNWKARQLTDIHEHKIVKVFGNP